MRERYRLSYISRSLNVAFPKNMQIFIHRNGQQAGPFSVEEIRDMLAARSIAPTDPGWHEGLTDWQPLNKILPIPAQTPATVPPPLKIPAQSTRTNAKQGANTVRGSILDFSIQKNEGHISGDDSKRYTFIGEEWRMSEPPVRGMRVDFTENGTVATAIFREISKTAFPSNQVAVGELNLAGLAPYYRDEFKKIQASGESYTGKWNWAAFLFGPFWAFTKGAWHSAVAALIVTLVTGGIGGIVYWFVFGMRGNYVYYTLHVKQKQLMF